VGRSRSGAKAAGAAAGAERALLIELCRRVRNLVQAGEWGKLQELVSSESAKRQVDEWTLTRQLVEVGIELGLAQPIQLQPPDVEEFGGQPLH
jgi:hypothetical protein